MQGQYRPADNGDLKTLNKRELQSDNYFSTSKSGPYSSLSYNTILRYGIKKNYELQVSWTGNKMETDTGDESNDVATVGVKSFLVDDSKYFPGITLIGSINLTADPKSKPLNPSLNILFEKFISKLAINGNYQFSLDEQNGDLSSNYSFNLETAFTKWLNVYVGLTGNKSYAVPNENATYQDYIELGFLIWAKDGITIYPFYDFGIRDNSDDIFNIGLIYFFK